MTLPRPRGTGRNLLDAYRLIPRLRPDWEFLLYHQHPLDDDTAPHDPPWRHPNVRLRRIDLPGDRFDAWLQVRLPDGCQHLFGRNMLGQGREFERFTARSDSPGGHQHHLAAGFMKGG